MPWPMFILFLCLSLTLAPAEGLLEVSLSLWKMLGTFEKSVVEGMRGTLWKRTENHQILIKLLHSADGVFAPALHPPNDEETFKVLKAIAEDPVYDDARALLLSWENTCSNGEFLKWAMRDGNYTPRGTLDMSTALHRMYFPETIDIFIKFLLENPEQRHNTKYIHQIHTAIMRKKTKEEFEHYYRKIQDIAGLNLVKSISSGLYGNQETWSQDVAMPTLRGEGSFLANSRLFAYVMNPKRLEKANEDYELPTEPLKNILLSQSNPEWGALVGALEAPKRDWGEISAHAHALIEGYVPAEKEYLGTLEATSIIWLFAGLFANDPPELWQDDEVKWVDGMFGSRVVGEPILTAHAIELWSSEGQRAALELFNAKQVFLRGVQQCDGLDRNYNNLVMRHSRNPEAQRRAYLKSSLPFVSLTLWKVADEPASLDAQAWVLSSSGWSWPGRNTAVYRGIQLLEGEKSAETVLDVALNYLKSALEAPGYLWDENCKIHCGNESRQRWVAFFRALPVLLLRHEKLPRIIGRLFATGAGKTGTFLAKPEELMYEWDEGDSDKRALYEALKDSFSSHGLDQLANLKELITEG